MRGWLFLVTMMGGCSSESALYLGLKPKKPVDEKPDAPPVVAGEGATLRGAVCAPSGDGYVTHADVTVFVEPVPVTTTTDADGAFEIKDLPAGTFHVEIRKGSFLLEAEVELVAGEVKDLSPQQDCVPLEQGDLEIAVVSGRYDKIQDLLDELGLTYDLVPGITGTAHVDLMRDRTALGKYDLIFFNCGMGDKWMDYTAEIADNLRSYVQGGGSVYASDWSHLMVEGPWPTENNFLGNDADMWDTRVGARGDGVAEVLDPAMISALGGDTADLHFDLDEWAALEGSNAEVLLQGDYKYWDRNTKKNGSGPFATRFHDGQGTVVFTSFHNENQTTADMLVLLQEIILSL